MPSQAPPGLLLATLALFAALLVAPSAARSEPDSKRPDTAAASLEESEEPGASEPDSEESALLEEGGASEDYEEIEALRELELEAMQPTWLSGESWDVSMLAPRRGALGALRREAGLSALEEEPEERPRGAALCDESSARRALEAARLLGSPLPLDEPELRAYVDFFDGRGKPTLARWIKRMGLYEAMILEVLREEHLPEELVYVAMIESGFSPTARSHASAVGLWQFIETTGLEMGLRIDRHVDERRDPVRATHAAARYLKKLYARYDSWPLALAAYNGGPGLVDREIDRYNSNDYWFIAQQRGMYDETRRYVPKVLAAAMMSSYPDHFGLQGLIKSEPWRYDLVEINSPTRLSQIASAIGSSVDELKRLNPALRAAATPPMESDERYELRLPEGKALAFVEHFDKVYVPEDERDFELHAVRFGESIAMLATHYGVKIRVLRAINGYGKRERLKLGEQVVIPRQEAAKSTSEGKKSGDKELVLVPAPTFDYGESRSAYIYRAQRGDRLEDVARAFGVSEADAAIWNALDVGAKLRDGMHLQLFLEEQAETDSLALRPASEYQVVAYGSPEYERLSQSKRASKRGRSSSSRYHKVRAGQSLWTIARKHRTTVAKLKRLNPKLKRDDTLQPGDKIRVR